MIVPNLSQWIRIGLVCGSSLLLASCGFDRSRYIKANNCNSLFSYERQLKPSAKIEQKFYPVVKQFAGDGLFFVDYFKKLGNKHCGRPAIDYMLFLKGYLRKQPKTDFQSMVDSVGTSVHETAHHYSSLALQFDQSPVAIRYKRAGYGYGRTSYYTPTMGHRHLLHTRTFPARQIEKVIEDKAVFKNSRYTSYISEASQYHVTQQFGIYGLLDEFHAYYYSLMTTNNILQQLDKKAREVSLGDNSFTELGNNDISLSFLEFKLFILSYFRTAEKYHPAIYKQLTRNGELLDVTLSLHDEFANVYNKFVLINLDKKLHDSFKKEREVLVGELARPENIQMLKKLRKANRKYGRKSSAV